jgi:site-specific recombinase XerD
MNGLRKTPTTAGDSADAVVPREQWETLVAALPSPRDRALLAVLLWSGLRVSECCTLEVEDVEFATSHLRRRGSRPGAVFCHPRALLHLRRYLAERPAPHREEGDPLFVSRQRRRLSPRQVWNIVRRAGLAAGVASDLHPHRLRRSHRSRLLAQSEDPLLVAQQLGYRDLRSVFQ